MNEVWNAWVDLFDSAVDQCTPKKNKRKNCRPLWISDDIVKVGRKKKRSYKKAKSSDNADLWSEYKNINNMLKKKCNQARWECLKDLSSNMHGKKNINFFGATSTQSVKGLMIWQLSN